MKETLQQLLAQATDSLKQQQLLPADVQANIQITNTKDKSHGDFATNLALMLAKPAGKSPRELAQALVAALPDSSAVEKVEIAGPGFINFFLTAGASQSIVTDILQQGANYGRSQFGEGTRIHMEFVSANPTGPLHVGHGRGAAFGAALASLLDAVGYHVHREYYVNDAGRQMHILAASVYLRYLQQCGEEFVFPKNGYKGEYVFQIATELKQQQGEALVHPAEDVFAGVSADENAQGEGDKDAHVDDLIDNVKRLLGEEHYQLVFNMGLDAILQDIREDLAEFGVHYDEWFSEKSLMDSGAIAEALKRLTEAGYIYEKGGAKWFRSTDFGDDKDRVVVRDNGQSTYFASDIAYHMNKLDRGNHLIIDVLGADHHGYVPRVKASMQALGAQGEQLIAPLVQFAILYRGGERVQMSTRSGSFVTLRELREEVGNDAARFFYVMRKSDQHMDFDLDLAKSESSDNPVYYIQYAHARVCSVWRQLDEQSLRHDPTEGEANLALLDNDYETRLMDRLRQFPDLLVNAARNYAPHSIAHYLRDLANDFHSYYNAEKFIVEQSELRNARLNLILAVKQVLANGLRLLGVNAPDKM